VLHNIRGVVGTPVFWAGIRSYYARHKDGTATSDDFRRAMEEACRSADRCPADGRDLSWLFSQLLNRGGALQVQGSWSYDAPGKQLQITLEQTQKTGLYRMPIEVRITTSAPPAAGRGGSGTPAASVPSRSTQIVQLTQQRQTFALPSDLEPSNVELDPDAWTMMQATFLKK
jgi:aminopeptidase N